MKVGTHRPPAPRGAAFVDGVERGSTIRDEARGPVDSEAKRVLVMIATGRVGGPLKGIFQYLRHADPARWSLLLALFQVVGRPTSDAMQEARAQAVPHVLLQQCRRFDTGLLVQARAAIVRHRVSIVQSHGYKTHILGWRLKRSMGLPWLAFTHGWTAENWRVRLYHSLDCWLLRFADRVVAVSDELASRLRQRGIPPDRLLTIHNAVDLDEGLSGCERGAFRRSLGIPPNAPLIAVIGRLSLEKGQGLFLESFQRLSSARPDAHAVLVGEGIDLRSLKERVGKLGLEKSVHFTGYQRRVAPIYKDSDLIAIPSIRREGIPNVLLEAMSAGCPIVASRIGGIPEIVRHEQEAFLVPPGDPVALADAMRHVLEDVPLRERLIGQGKHCIIVRHSPAARAARIFEAYESLVR
jgi:glycosyltransferase involved in cell wall biosynthesis